MVKRLFDLGFAAAVFACSIWFWLIADGFPVSPRFQGIDTDFWPKIVFGTLALVAGCLVARMALDILRERKTVSATAPIRGGGRGVDPQAVATVMRVAAMAGLVLAYYIGFRVVGFAIATVLFLWAASFVLVYRNWVVKLIFAPVFTLALTLFFSRVLSLPLPRGMGRFYEINLLLY